MSTDRQDVRASRRRGATGDTRGPDIPFAKVWPFLKSKGWTFMKGGKIHDWLYVPEVLANQTAGQIINECTIGTDFWTGQKDVAVHVCTDDDLKQEYVQWSNENQNNPRP